MPRLLGGFVSPALRWWSPWWWPLVHLCSFRCRLLDGSLYTLSSQIANQDNTDTTKTIANTSIRRRVATTRRRHKDSGHHSHGHAAPRPHPGHDGHATTSRARRPRHGHDGRDTATATTRPRSHKRNVPARYHTTRQNTIAQTFQRCTMQQTPP